MKVVVETRTKKVSEMEKRLQRPESQAHEFPETAVFCLFLRGGELKMIRKLQSSSCLCVFNGFSHQPPGPKKISTLGEKTEENEQKQVAS